MEEYIDVLAATHQEQEVTSASIRRHFLQTAQITTETRRELSKYNDLNEMFDFLAVTQFPYPSYCHDLDARVLDSTKRKDTVGEAVDFSRELIIRQTRVNHRRPERCNLVGSSEILCVEVLMRYLPTEISVALKSHKFSTFYELTDHAAWLEGNASGKRNVPVYAMEHKKDSGVNHTHGRRGVHFANQKHEWRRHKGILLNPF